MIEAPDVSGVLSFCWGVATLVVPVFETLILGATATATATTDATTLAEDAITHQALRNNTFHTTASTFMSSFTTNTTASPVLATAQAIESIPGSIPGEAERSFGNQMVMTMLCAFLGCASITQFVMYFRVIRKS